MINIDKLKFFGRYYAIDLEKVMDFVSAGGDKERENAQTITLNYGMPILEDGSIAGEFQLVGKEISETKENKSDNFIACRYGMLSNLIDIIAKCENIEADGAKLIFITLLNMGIIYEVTE